MQRQLRTGPVGSGVRAVEGHGSGQRLYGAARRGSAAAAHAPGGVDAPTRGSHRGKQGRQMGPA
jgi:hypothetical protein